MRKSSQGGRRVSQPLRMDSDEFRASSSRRTLDARRGSAIPQPKGRRSSSETRDSRFSTLPAAVKRSRSQVNIYVTPAGQNMITPLRDIPSTHFGSGQSQRFTSSPFSDAGRSSRKSAYSGVGPGKPGRIIKDTRPLTDKNFLQQQIQMITSFLYSQPDVLNIAPKGINLRQLTMKLFVDIVNYLMSFLDENISVNMTNYVNEIPLIMKKWGYTGNLNTSWMKTVNTPHALPHVIGLLSWLVTLASCVVQTDYEAVLQESLQNDDDGADESFPYGNSVIYMQHLLKQYRLWNTNDEVGEENEEERLIAELLNRNGVSDEEFREISDSVQAYEMQLNDPKEKAEVEAAQEEERKYTEFMKGYYACVEYKAKMEEFLHTAETALEEEKLRLQKEEEACINLRNNVFELKEQLSKQIMTVEERDEMIRLSNDLNSAIRENEEYIAVVSNQIYSDDLDLAKERANIKKKTQKYNTIILMESSWLPELQALKDNTNFLHQGAQDELSDIDSIARQLKADQQKTREEISYAIKDLKTKQLQVEERKSLVLNEVQQLKHQVKINEENIEETKTRSTEETIELKKTIDSLRSANEDRIHCTSLEEAKEKLKKVTEKRDYGIVHIERLKKKAEVFFTQSAAITQGLIDNVLKAEAEFLKKREEVLKTARDQVTKSKLTE